MTRITTEYYHFTPYNGCCMLFTPKECDIKTSEYRWGGQDLNLYLLPTDRNFNTVTYIKTRSRFVALCWQHCPVLWALKSTPIEIKSIRWASPSKVIDTTTHWGSHWIFSLDKFHKLINLKFIDTIESGRQMQCNFEQEKLTLGWLKRLVCREGLREPWKGSCRWPFNLQDSESWEQAEWMHNETFFFLKLN